MKKVKIALAIIVLGIGMCFPALKVNAQIMTIKDNSKDGFWLKSIPGTKEENLKLFSPLPLDTISKHGSFYDFIYHRDQFNGWQILIIPKSGISDIDVTIGKITCSFSFKGNESYLFNILPLNKTSELNFDETSEEVIIKWKCYH